MTAGSANAMDGAEEVGRRELVRLTPFLLVKVLLIVLIVEFGVMLALPRLHLRSGVLENIVDSFLLVALSAVPLHLLVLRPTMRLISKSVAHYEHLSSESVRESEDRFRTMADGCPIGIWVTDAQGGTRFINRAYEEFCGVPFERLEADLWHSLLHPADASKFVGAFQLALKEQKSFKAEYRGRRADGEWRWLESYASPRFSPDGQFLGLVGASKDISDRKEAEQALQNSEEKFRQLAENIREVFWVMSPSADKVLYVSPAYEQVWGRTCDSLYQNPMSWTDAIHPGDTESAHLLFARQLTGEHIDSEYRIRTPDGQEKWIRDRAFPIRDEDDQLIRVVGIAEEVTERKRYEGELRKIASVVEASTDFIGFASLDFQVQYVNQAGRRMVGLDDEVSVGGLSIVDLVANEERADFTSPLA